MELTSKKRLINKGLPGFFGGKFGNKTGIVGIAPGMGGSIYPSQGVGSDDYIGRVRPLQDVGSITNSEGGKTTDDGGSKSKPDYSGIVPKAIGFAGSLVNAATPMFDTNDLIAGAQTSTGNIGGITYSKKLGVDSSVTDQQNAKRISDIFNSAASGSSLGSGLFKAKKGKLPKFFIGGALLGAGIGAIGGGLLGTIAQGKEDEAIRNANSIMSRQNDFNKNGAMSTLLQQRYALDNIDPRDQPYRNYKCGKLPGFVDGKRVQSANGLINADQNSWVDGDELIVNTITGATHRVPSSRYTDSYPAHLNEEDLVIPARVAKKMKGFKNGKLPKFYGGNGFVDNTDNAIVRSLGMINGLGQAWMAANSPVKTPNTYVPNTFGRQAANTMAGLRVSDYPILPELYNQYAKGMYAISNSGGLSGGQRALARLAALNNLQNNFAKLQQANQIQNNQYKQNYADFIAKLGAQEASDKMNALRWDLDYYSKAHAAKQKGIQTGLAAAQNNLEQYYKDKIKGDQFNSVYGLYMADQKARQEEIAAMNEYNKLLSKIKQA